MCQTVASYSSIIGSRRAIGAGLGSERSMWQRQIQLRPFSVRAAPQADRLRVVDDDRVPLALQALGVDRVDLVEELPLLVAQRLLGALQRVVEELGRVEELLLAEDHVPVGVEADVAHQRHDRVEDLRDAAAEGGGADVQDAVALQRLGELADPLDQLLAGDVGVVGEGLVAEGDFLKQARSSTGWAADGAAGRVSRRSVVGPLAERDLDLLPLAVVEDRQRHLVAGLVGGDEAGEVVGADDLVAVDLRGSRRRRSGTRPAWKRSFSSPPSSPAFSAGPPGTTSASRPPKSVSSPSLRGELRVERLAGDADVGVFGAAVVCELGERALDRRDRDGEADPVVGARVGLDLLVDADHAGAGVEQRPAGVAGVDRGVGLDRALDLELGQRFDRAVGGRDDPDRERLLLAEGAADRRHRLADDAGRGRRPA